MLNYMKKENIIIAVIVVVILVVGAFAFFSGKKSKKSTKVKTQHSQTKKNVPATGTNQTTNP